MNSVTVVHVFVSADNKVNFFSRNRYCRILFETDAYWLFGFLSDDYLAVFPFEEIFDFGFVII